MSNDARFAFKSKGLEVEFEGHPDFIAGQIAFLKARIGVELGDGGKRAAGTPEPVRSPSGDDAAPAGGATAGEGAADSADSESLDDPTLEQFYRRAKSRHGRGALQETILIFAYFLREYREKDELSIESLNACFSLVGAAAPKSLANTLGIMKRNQKFFHSGSQRGHYTLTDKGIGYVGRLIGAR
jgi:hypothetical protein